MTPEQQETYEQGRTYFEQGKLNDSLRCFLELIKDNPYRFADVHNKVGVIYHNKGIPENAIASFEKALKVNPSYTEAAINLSIVYNELGKYEEASKIFHMAVKTVSKARKIKDPYIEGKLANEHAHLGSQYYDLGRYKEAIIEYKKALKLRPWFADIITQLGIAYRDNGEFEKAIETFQKAIEINQRHLPAVINLGITYYMMGFVDLALREWKNALAIDPDNRDARVYISLVSSARY